MQNMKDIIIIFILFSISFFAKAQTRQTVEEISDKYQVCLDSGINMLGCSEQFCLQMDSMLHVVYNKLKMKLNSTEKAQLEKEQLVWLKKRDIYFAEQKKEFQSAWKKGEAFPEILLFRNDNCAAYVKTRVLVLLKKLSR